MNSNQDQPALSSPPAYRGRFAPTPSGPLHFGSLVAALASWLDARAGGGEWILRIEDIDPPRCDPGAIEKIQSSLVDHGLKADGPVLFQSHHCDRYERALAQLQRLGKTYYCRCTRAQIKQQGGHDNLACRAQQNTPGEGAAVRFVATSTNPAIDLIQRAPGTAANAASAGNEKQIADPVLKRRDGLYGYPLAVAVDDLEEGYTHIIRGADLMEFTALQCEIMTVLGGTPPHYGHIPVVTNRDGLKLSKQNHALPLSGERARQNLLDALMFLGQRLDKASKADSIGGLLDCAIQNWRRDRIPRIPSAAWPPITC